MGGNRFFNRMSGYNMQDAYKKACDEAEDEYGHQQNYSGEINSTGGFIDVTKEFQKSKLTSLDAFERKLDNENRITKGNAYGICTREPVPNKNKIKTIVNDKVLKGTRVWKMVYTVYNYNDENLGSAVLKADAVKIARTYTEKTRNKTVVVVERNSVQSPTVAEILYKSGPNEAPGEYVFFGIASC
jgi:hypothetical protein